MLFSKLPKNTSLLNKKYKVFNSMFHKQEKTQAP